MIKAMRDLYHSAIRSRRLEQAARGRAAEGMRVTARALSDADKYKADAEEADKALQRLMRNDDGTVNGTIFDLAGRPDEG